jgi:hypothetical protein
MAAKTLIKKLPKGSKVIDDFEHNNLVICEYNNEYIVGWLNINNREVQYFHRVYSDLESARNFVWDYLS